MLHRELVHLCSVADICHILLYVARVYDKHGPSMLKIKTLQTRNKGMFMITKLQASETNIYACS